MDKKKLDNYNLTASIHTVQVDSSHIPAIKAGDERFVKSHNTINQDTGEVTSRNKINPHNYGAGELLSYSLYKNVMSELTDKIKLHSYDYSRIDIRLDSYEDNYQDYLKLNSLLIGLFATVFTFKNGEPTESAGHRTRYKCGVYVKSQYMSIDYYDKKKESQNRYPCKTRLEFRAMRLNGKTPTDIATLWFKRFDKLPAKYNQLQENYNSSIYQYYLSWLKKNQPKNGKKDMLTQFVRENKDYFFTSRQLKNFCEMCGTDNSASRAKCLKQTCGIEFFSHSDIKSYIEKIKNSITQYLDQ